MAPAKFRNIIKPQAWKKRKKKMCSKSMNSVFVYEFLYSKEWTKWINYEGNFWLAESTIFFFHLQITWLEFAIHDKRYVPWQLGAREARSGGLEIRRFLFIKQLKMDKKKFFFCLTLCLTILKKYISPDIKCSASTCI